MRAKPSAVVCPMPMMTMRWIKALADCAYPRLCLTCGCRLHTCEDYLCASCLSTLPRTYLHTRPDNTMELRFRGLVPVVRTASFIFYAKSNPACAFFRLLKNGGDPRVGQYFGALYARELLRDGFFDDIDLLIPVPLAPHKLRQRGYNQATAIAQGIAQATGLPVATDTLSRVVDNPTQRRKDKLERWDNARAFFTIDNPLPQHHRHFLLIDDIVTTGSTLTACAQTLLQLPGSRISLLTLGITKL